MAGAGKKTFTAGEVLTASDVNTYLMEQSVMVFGGTAARSSAIPTPTTGMTSYQTDKKQLDSYNGSAWVGMGGLQLVKTQEIGTGVSSVTVSNAFSSTYDAYKIIYLGGTASTTCVLLFALNGITSGYYTCLNYQDFGSATVSGAQLSNASYLEWSGHASTNYVNMDLQILAPNLTKTKTSFATFTAQATNGSNGISKGFINSTVAATGFTITPSAGTITGGTIAVYGYAK